MHVLPTTLGRTMQQPGMHVQGHIKRAQQTNQDPAHCARADVPAAVFQRVERDRLNVGFYLNQGPAMTAILHGLEELGWPAALESSHTPRSALVVEYITALLWGLKAYMHPKAKTHKRVPICGKARHSVCLLLSAVCQLLQLTV